MWHQTPGDSLITPTLILVESRKLYRKGHQWNDLMLLASTLVSEAPLWTLDHRLATAAREAGVAYLG